MIRIQQVDTLMAREQPHVEDLVDNQRPLDAEGFPQVRLSVREYLSISFSQSWLSSGPHSSRIPGFLRSPLYL